jgi:catechol 2,3-dioxygenase-like lactoylglutathione lyase family enzyme
MTTTASMPNLFTRDIDAAVTFYRDRLGFGPLFQVPAEGRPEHIVLQLGSSQLALSTDRAVSTIGLRYTAGNPYELIVWCDDVDASAETLRGAGVPIAVEPYDHVAGHRRCYVLDPDGNWVALVDAG